MLGEEEQLLAEVSWYCKCYTILDQQWRLLDYESHCELAQMHLIPSTRMRLSRLWASFEQLGQ